MQPNPLYCTECGAPLEPGAKYCEQCGTEVESPGNNSIPSPPGDSREKPLGIVPFVFCGSILSPRYHTLILTPRRFVFIPCNPTIDEELVKARDALTDEDMFDEVGDQRSYFIKKDWSRGPWMRFADMNPEQLVKEYPGAVTIPHDSITSVEIINDTGYSTDDAITIRTGDATFEWTVEFAQGPRLFFLLEPVLHERVTMESVGEEESG